MSDVDGMAALAQWGSSVRVRAVAHVSAEPGESTCLPERQVRGVVLAFDREQALARTGRDPRPSAQCRLVGIQDNDVTLAQDARTALDLDTHMSLQRWRVPELDDCVSVIMRRRVQAAWRGTENQAVRLGPSDIFIVNRHALSSPNCWPPMALAEASPRCAPYGRYWPTRSAPLRSKSATSTNRPPGSAI